MDNKSYEICAAVEQPDRKLSSYMWSIQCVACFTESIEPEMTIDEALSALADGFKVK